MTVKLYHTRCVFEILPTLTFMYVEGKDESQCSIAIAWGTINLQINWIIRNM